MKKIGALVLAVVMVMAMSVTAFADTTLGANGEQGAFTNPDTPVSQSKTLVLSKEIKAYNLDETTVKAPDISYTYTIGAATVPAGATITDKAGNPVHAAGVNVTAPVKAGVGTPTIANSGVVAWSNTDNLAALTGGDSNKKDISIDFSSVVFEGAGVYRYVITEALTSGYTYASSGVTETDGTHARYIDVYVRPSTVTTATTDLDPYNNGSTAREWDIYGFTCFYNNDDEITEANKTTDAVKTTGFVAGTTDGSTAVSADSYYTFNLTVSKEVVNDGYGASTVAFPFTVIFTNANVTKTVDIIGNIESATVTGWTDPAVSAMSDGAASDPDNSLIKGIVNIKSGGQIKYIGIPNGTSVEVYETNIATGVTYKVDTVLTTTTTATTTDQAVISGSAPASAVAQAATKADEQSTKATFSTTADADDDNDYTVAITNTLLTISPTGVTLRIAPYALMLFAGIVLFVITRRRRTAEEDA